MQKKLLLSIALVASIGSASAQGNFRAPKGKMLPVNREAFKMRGDNAVGPVQNSGTQSPSGARIAADFGEQIGLTWYDSQSNANTGSRLVRHADGTLSAVWTEACTGPSSTWPERGVGYNYNNGTSWIYGADATCNEPGSDFGIASARVGWPEIGAFASGKEFALFHTPLNFSVCPQKGTCAPNAWSANAAVPVTGEGIQWPRLSISGSTAHVLASADAVVNGVDGGLSYYRSTDEGVTWQEIMLPDHDTASSFPNPAILGADAYAIDSRGSTVAIIMGAYDNDWVLWKSVDNGSTFTKTTIRDFNPDVNNPDTVMYSSNDKAMDVVIDKNNVVHVLAGEYKLGIVSGVWESFEPFGQEGIWYWNDGNMAGMQPTLIVTQIEDIYPTGDPKDFVGSGEYEAVPKFAPYGYLGLNSMARAAVDDNNNIHVVYSGVVEGTSDNGLADGQSYRDLYYVRVTNAGGTPIASSPLNIGLNIAGVARTEFEERVYPAVARTVGSDNLLHFTWQNDDLPGSSTCVATGSSFSDCDPNSQNDIIYYSFDVSTVSAPQPVAKPINSVSAVPNPTTGIAHVNVELTKAAGVQVRVNNLLGQEIANVNSAATNGTTATVQIDLSAQPAGIYLYTVTTDNYSVTNKLVKQ